MAKKTTVKEETEKIYIIKKASNYNDQKVILPLSKELIDKFNNFEEIEVTESQLNEIGYHRWLISEVK